MNIEHLTNGGTCLDTIQTKRFSCKTCRQISTIHEFNKTGWARWTGRYYQFDDTDLIDACLHICPKCKTESPTSHFTEV